MAPSSPIELIIFDLDDVLGHLDRDKRLSILSAVTGKPAQFLHERIWASDFESSAERGAYATGDEYLAEFNRRTGCELTREQWIRARREATTLDREVLQIAKEVSKRHCIALLTNNGSLLRESLGQILPEVERLFGSRAHASFEFNARKPEAAVFERLLARYAVEPSRAVFIDDSAEYLAGARHVGLNGIQFTSASSLRNSLAALGVLP